MKNTAVCKAPLAHPRGEAAVPGPLPHAGESAIPGSAKGTRKLPSLVCRKCTGAFLPLAHVVEARVPGALPSHAGEARVPSPLTHPRRETYRDIFPICLI